MTIQKPLAAESGERIGRWTRSPAISGGPGAYVYLYADAATGRHTASMAELYRDFQAGSGRELVTINHPNEHSSGIVLVAPVHKPN